MGNLGPLVDGCASRRTALGRLRALTVCMGSIALAGSVLFFSRQGMGTGVAILAARARDAVSMGTPTRADVKTHKS